MADKSLISINQQVSDETQAAAVMFVKTILAPAAQGLGIATDFAKGLRMRISSKTLERTKAVCAERGIEVADSKLDFSYFYPWMEASSAVTDSTLQEMWAQLLASAISSETDQHPKFIECMKLITKDETIMLSALGNWEHPTQLRKLSATDESGEVFELSVPANQYAIMVNADPTANAKPIKGLRFPEQLPLYFDNLVSLGLAQRSAGGGAGGLTPLGVGFLKACGVQTART